MTLMRFLAVGRSIGAVPNAPSRYRMNAQGLLPKFGRQGANTRPATAPQSALAPAPAESVPAPAFEEKTSLPDKCTPGHSMAVQSQEGQPSGGGASRWKWFRFTHRFGSKRAPRAAGPPVQGELALDMVRPVRNDLSDSDFEILTPTKAKAAPVVIEPPPPPPAMQLAKPGVKVLWGRVRGRLFGAAETHAR